MSLARFFTATVAAVMVLALVCLAHAGEVTLTDGIGRSVTVPDKVERVICSGSGCLRLLTYLGAQDMAVAADDMEGKRQMFDARPYALANPGFKKLPVFGEFRGHDNPEQILTLEPQPQVIFKSMTSGIGYDPDELQQKTGIPVVVLVYGDMGRLRQHLYASLRLMGDVVGKRQRAEEVIAFFQDNIDELNRRTASVPESERPTVYVGGIASRGPHGYQSTEPAYPPFLFVNAANVAYSKGLTGKELAHADVAKEKIVEWNPDLLFVDLSTLQLGQEAGAVYELKTDPAYRTLSAVQTDKVYGLLPYNWYSKNFGSVLANAWYIGSVVYPDRFPNLDPAAKADEIYTFLVGKPVFPLMDKSFGEMAFKPVPVN